MISCLATDKYLGIVVVHGTFGRSEMEICGDRQTLAGRLDREDGWARLLMKEYSAQLLYYYAVYETSSSITLCSIQFVLQISTC